MVKPGARVVITVDGLAASGKSSISRELARRLGFRHFSSGLLYRAVGLQALKGGVDVRSEDQIGKFVESHQWEVGVDAEGGARVSMDGSPVGGDLSGPQTSEAASCVATSRRVRQALVEPQRTAFALHSIVAEGRDLGTVIFPEAPLKLFIEVPEDVRIARRLQQWRHERGNDVVVNEQVLRAEILERDRRDAERALAPTVAAPDAVIVDNSSRTLTEVVDSLYHLAHSRGLVTGS